MKNLELDGVVTALEVVGLARVCGIDRRRVSSRPGLFPAPQFSPVGEDHHCKTALRRSDKIAVALRNRMHERIGESFPLGTFFRLFERQPFRDDVPRDRVNGDPPPGVAGFVDAG